MLLSDVARHVRTYGNRLARRHGTTLAQAAILERLEHAPDISQNELAAVTELAPMTVGCNVRCLVFALGVAAIGLHLAYHFGQVRRDKSAQ